jgi:hypothetical protein
LRKIKRKRAWRSQFELKLDEIAPTVGRIYGGVVLLSITRIMVPVPLNELLP